MIRLNNNWSENSLRNNNLILPSKDITSNKTLEDSKKIFLENIHDENRKKRKISFKIKNSISSNRKVPHSTTFRLNKVQELTNKFNELMHEQPEMVQMIKRGNSIKSEQNKKPVIRPKPHKIEDKKMKKKIDDTKVNSVRETIEIFERKYCEKPKIPEKKVVKTKELVVKDGIKKLKILNNESTKKLYETLNITHTTLSTNLLKINSEERKSLENNILPNNSFLWRSRSKDGATFNIYTTIDYEDNTQNIDTGQLDNIYDIVEIKNKDETITKHEQINKTIDKNDYETFHDYEYPETEDIYETMSTNYETLSLKTVNIPNITSESASTSEEDIYASVKDETPNYETIERLCVNKIDENSSSDSNRDSLISYELQSNSLYGKYEYKSDSSSQERSNIEDWIDISDNEDDLHGFVIVREKQKVNKKNSGWSNKVRDQWSKSSNKTAPLQEDESFHYYESLHSDEDFDSFDSESDDESFTKVNPNDSGVEMGLTVLPEPPQGANHPSGNIYGFTRLAARLRKNWSLTKNDISKSLSRMTKKRSGTPSPKMVGPKSGDVTMQEVQKVEESLPYQNVHFGESHTLSRKKNWLKFRRAGSMGEASSEYSAPLQVFNPNRSTFYLPNNAEQQEQEVVHRPQVPVRRRAPRPQSPPPPAPVGPQAVKSNKEKVRSTSWYAECGLFKATEIPSEISRSSSTCWYAEVGLYQEKSKNNNISCSSVENSGNSTFYTSDNNQDEYYNVKNQNYQNSEHKKLDKMATLLRDEPLYQFYDAAVADNALNESSSDSEYDGYEEIGELIKVEENTIIPPKRTSVRRLQGSRTLWCEIPEVINSEILKTLTSVQKKLQEAKFEILTSEISYLNSLNILIEHFYQKIDVISEENRKILFGNIESVKKCSENLLNDLEVCWNDSILLLNVCEVILKHCKENFGVYVDYCANQTCSDSVLRKLRGDLNPKNGKSPNLTRFGEVLKMLEESSVCQGLNLHSFLMLPMQRVTRLPLLLDAVLRRLTPSDEEFVSCQASLRGLQDLALRCNEAARQAERSSEIKRLSTQIDFPAGVPVLDLLAEGTKRYLVKSGDLTQLLSRNGAKAEDQTLKLTFGKRFNKQSITLLLFDDWIILAKKKSEDSYVVLHHCPRSFIELSQSDLSSPMLDSSLLLFLTLLENQDGKEVSLLLLCGSESERLRWEQVLRPQQAEDPNETIYETWDCPQVQAIHHYDATQPDELNLNRGDVVNISKKLKDSWFYGERLRDGALGWFPGNHSIEIANPHVRARNLRQRYRLLAYTDEFLNNSQNK